MKKTIVVMMLAAMVSASATAFELKPEHKKICEQVASLQRADGLFKSPSGKADVTAAETADRLADFIDLFTVLSHYYSEFAAMYPAIGRFVEAIDGWQRPNGLWGTVLDDPASKDDPAASARIACLCAKGMQQRVPMRNFELLDWGYLGVAKKALAGLEKAGVSEDQLKDLRNEIAAGDKMGTWGKSLRLTPSQRAEAGHVAKPGEFRLEPTYECISVSWGAPGEFQDGVKMEYRKVGEKAWREALAPVYTRPNHNYRGSIVHLEEDTEYEVRIGDVSGKARTWATKVPIAETVELDADGATYPIVINRHGKPDGWIRYVPKDGKTFVNDSFDDTFLIHNARYVILDGFTVVGGKSAKTVRIDDSVGVRLLNWEMSGWGPGGAPRWGKQRGLCFEGDLCVQCGAIVLGSNLSEVTIERCFIHSPRGRSHSWRYSHPYGPEGIQARHPVSTVIRWCDIVGCDSRRFEDCIKCVGNDGYDAGLNRNADVYGCFLFGANDDCIELDGGQQNVRFFQNRCEEALMGASIQLVMTGPSYVFENAFTGLGTEFGHRCSAVKTSSVDAFGYGNASFVLHNTFCGPGSEAEAVDMSANAATARLNVFNNLCVGEGQGIKGTNGLARGKLGGNFITLDGKELIAVEKANVTPVMGRPVKPIPNFTRNAVAGAAAASVGSTVCLPMRPIPWTLDAGRFAVTVAKGVPSQSTAPFRLACGGKGYKRPFKVRTTGLDHDWFDVTPKEGVIESGKMIAFNVTFDASKLNGRREYAAAFLIRTNDGFSRPVSLHAYTDFVGPYKVENPQGDVVYAAKTDAANWTFDVPKDGTYYLFVRGLHPKATGNDFMPKVTALTLTFDGESWREAFPQLRHFPTWAPVNPRTYNITGYELKAGKHTLKIDKSAEGLAIEGFALVTEPLDMEGEKRN